MAITNNTGITFTGTEQQRSALLGVAFARLEAAKDYADISPVMAKAQLDMAINSFRVLLGTPPKEA